MKILTERDKFLSDYEVLKHLKELRAKYSWGEDDKSKKTKPSGGGPGLELINKQTLDYLNHRPCSHVPSDNSFTQLAVFLNQFQLVKVEKLQIINSLPRSMVHLYALIEECDQRLDEDACNNILEKINDLFPIETEEAEEPEAEA